jgi:hypothetical protein
LTYAGGDGIDAARTEPATVDPSKATVDMTVSTSVTPEGVLVTVVTTADGAALSVPVTLRITATDKDEPHKDVATRSGQPTLIRRLDALGAGSRRITARFAGDTGHAAATTAVVVELASDTTTTVTAPASAAYDATIRLRGRVVDADGVGVAKVTVTAAGEGKRRVGSATTGADGTFRIDVEASLLGTGRHGLVLSAEPREAWLRASQSTGGDRHRRFAAAGAGRDHDRRVRRDRAHRARVRVGPAAPRAARARGPRRHPRRRRAAGRARRRAPEPGVDLAPRQRSRLRRRRARLGADPPAGGGDDRADAGRRRAHDGQRPRRPVRVRGAARRRVDRGRARRRSRQRAVHA